jgi:hypothetical protein
VTQLRDLYDQEVITELDLRTAGFSTIIWATGYSFDFSLVKVPVVDADGYPLQKRGVTAYEGLYFLGMPWLHSRKSGILFGVGEDAAYLARHIAGRQVEQTPGVFATDAEHISRFCPLMSSVSEYGRRGAKCRGSLAKALPESNVFDKPASLG